MFVQVFFKLSQEDVLSNTTGNYSILSVVPLTYFMLTVIVKENN